ncbi:MAG: TldD/PmbA family protein [Clostridia bacterium]|nr:TldD/PmbA family protein [Clostridia bacterium]
MSEYMKKLISDINDHAELRMQTARTRRVSIVGGALVGNMSSVSKGIGARVYKNGVWGFASKSNTDENSAKEVLLSATENAGLLSAKIPKNKGKLINAQCVQYSEKRAFTDVSQKTLVDFAKEVDSYIEKKYPALTSRHVGLSTGCIEKTLYTSEGSFAYQLFPRTYMIVSMSIEASDGTNIELFDVMGGGEGYFSDHYSDPALLFPMIDSLYEELINKKEGIFPDAGEALCIIDSSIAGMVAHEAVGHTVEADLVLAGSVAASNLGKEVASPLISLTDFAHTAFGEKAPLPVYVDDEGTLCQDAVIIKDGVLQGYMNNLESALHFGVKPLGNARAYAFSDEPLIRMRNTAIHPGKDKLEDMIASVDKGYYLTRTQNGQADTTGEFMFGITMGYEIKNGKLGKALRDTTISGVAFNMLKSVDMLSDTVSWDFAGYCGKKQPMPVSMGGPSIRCKVNIGGR